MNPSTTLATIAVLHGGASILDTNKLVCQLMVSSPFKGRFEMGANLAQGNSDLLGLIPLHCLFASLIFLFVGGVEVLFLSRSSFDILCLASRLCGVSERNGGRALNWARNRNNTRRGQGQRGENNYKEQWHLDAPPCKKQLHATEGVLVVDC